MPPAGLQILGRSEAPALVLLHGWLGCKEDWLPLACELAKDYCCLLFDLPGHGQNCTDIEGFQECRLWLQAAFKELGLQEVYLLGYSLGGRVALDYSAHFPEQVKALILESASPGLRSQEEREQRLLQDQQLAERLCSQNYQQFLIQWYQLPLFGKLAQHPDFAQLLQRRQRQKPETLAEVLLGLSPAQQHNYWPWLAQNPMPLLCLVGQQDQKYLQIAQQIVHSHPQTVLQVLNAAHCGHLEDPQNWLQAVKQFLKVQLADSSAG